MFAGTCDTTRRPACFGPLLCPCRVEIAAVWSLGQRCASGVPQNRSLPYVTSAGVTKQKFALCHICRCATKQEITLCRIRYMKNQQSSFTALWLMVSHQNWTTQKHFHSQVTSFFWLEKADAGEQQMDLWCELHKKKTSHTVATQYYHFSWLRTQMFIACCESQRNYTACAHSPVAWPSAGYGIVQVLVLIWRWLGPRSLAQSVPFFQSPINAFVPWDMLCSGCAVGIGC